MVHGITPGAAATPGPPLLVIAGAGTGKTKTLAHRVAHLLLNGADPRRILLLTFTRRAAQTMIRRVERITAAAREGRPGSAAAIDWAGTFHAVANRLLRLHAPGIGLAEDFTLLDRSDSADLMDVVRDELRLARTDRRFPRKGTCLAIYSYAVNAQAALPAVLEGQFPWCAEWADELKGLFRAYVAEKQRQNLLDYDDLLLYWELMMRVPGLAAEVGARFDHVLVDEYQDTNLLQASILGGLKPEGRGLTVVGDDAQSIYAFRAASVRNILDFPERFSPPAAIVRLQANYRSTQPLLDAANAMIALAAEGFEKELSAARGGGARPLLVAVREEAEQVDWVIGRLLANREAGMRLKDQAVLMRASSHSAALELELVRRNVPYVKFGGLRFLEAAHIKDVLAFLRWAENPRDRIAAFRTLQLLPGIGPGHARRLGEALEPTRSGLAGLAGLRPPQAAADLWPAFADLLADLAACREWAGQIERVRRFYDPLLPELHENPRPRLLDLDQLETLAGRFATRERFLTELALDPPETTGDEAGAPLKDEDWLTLSTIHSAKGQEWKAVFVLNIVDGCIPSDMATGTPAEIEEERRLLYVAMTRARDELCLMQPERFFVGRQARFGDRFVRATRTRFLPDALLPLFERRVAGAIPVGERAGAASGPPVDLAAQLRGMWD
ncbi:ATP-dependent helicase [Geminicoccaceae bacterium 1502E]|nr:ATP-dependent helicase [Geminicoccaceae bacterium 1502E]